MKSKTAEYPAQTSEMMDGLNASLANEDPASALPALRPVQALEPQSVPHLALTEDGPAVLIRQTEMIKKVWQASIELTSPQDWLLFRDREGNETGYLQESGALRVALLWQIEVTPTSGPIKDDDPKSEEFSITWVGDAYSGLTGATVKAQFGTRFSFEDFVKGKPYLECLRDVKKAAHASMSGSCIRHLTGMKNVPIAELERCWKHTDKDTRNCRHGKGYGSQAERQGADFQVADGLKQSDAPNCPKCGAAMDLKEGGVSRRTGNRYDPFWTCPKRSCDGKMDHGKFMASRKPQPTSSEPSEAPPLMAQIHSACKAAGLNFPHDVLAFAKDKGETVKLPSDISDATQAQFLEHVKGLGNVNN